MADTNPTPNRRSEHGIEILVSGSYSPSANKKEITIMFELGTLGVTLVSPCLTPRLRCSHGIKEPDTKTALVFFRRGSTTFIACSPTLKVKGRKADSVECESQVLWFQ